MGVGKPARRQRYAVIGFVSHNGGWFGWGEIQNGWELGSFRSFWVGGTVEVEIVFVSYICRVEIGFVSRNRGNGGAGAVPRVLGLGSFRIFGLPQVRRGGDWVRFVFLGRRMLGVGRIGFVSRDWGDGEGLYIVDCRM